MVRVTHIPNNGNLAHGDLVHATHMPANESARRGRRYRFGAPGAPFDERRGRFEGRRGLVGQNGRVVHTMWPGRDGQETIFEFGAPGGMQRIATCETDVDPNHPLFLAVSKAITFAAPLWI